LSSCREIVILSVAKDLLPARSGNPLLGWRVAYLWVTPLKQTTTIEGARLQPCHKPQPEQGASAPEVRLGKRLPCSLADLRSPTRVQPFSISALACSQQLRIPHGPSHACGPIPELRDNTTL
jgi:hypothetical protein